MTNSRPTSQERTEIAGNLALLSIASGVAFLLLVGALVYFGGRLGTLEDQLKHQPPIVEPTRAGMSYGIDRVAAQIVYVPVYSHIYGRGGIAFPLETTLSLRNTDAEHPIEIVSARYLDTQGELVKDYAAGLLRLGPLESGAILIEASDARGGSGANFLVSWKASAAVHEPIVEAVMIGSSVSQSISLVSPGRPLHEPRE